MISLTPDWLKTAQDIGGWAFATVAITFGAGWIIRWLLSLNDRLVASVDRLTQSVDNLTDEVRASRRR